jgi:hypothetical protein
VLGERLITEVVVGATRGEHQVVVSDGTEGGLHNAPVEVDAVDFGHAEADVVVAAEDCAHGLGY